MKQLRFCALAWCCLCWLFYGLRAEQSCSLQRISAANGSIADRTDTTPQYAPNLDCYWLVQPANARQIRLRWTQFSTELRHDVLTVYDGADTNAPVIGRFSGQTLPPSLVSSGGSVLLRFTTNAQAQDLGWRVEYRSSAQVSALRARPERLAFPPILFGQATLATLNVVGADRSDELVATASAGFRLALQQSAQMPEQAFVDTLRISAERLQQLLAANDTLRFLIRFQPVRTGSASGVVQIENAAAFVTCSLSAMAAPAVYWRPANGPFSGKIVSLALAPDNTVFAGTLTGVYRSNSSGVVWIESAVGLNANSERVVRSLFASASTVAAGTSDGLFLTRDGGRTWGKIASGMIENVQNVTGNADTLFVHANNAVFRSFDAGRSWQRLPSLQQNANGMVIDALLYANNQVFVGIYEQAAATTALYRSSDKGETWQRDNLFQGGNIRVQSFAVQALAEGQRVFVATAGGGLYKRDELPRQQNTAWQKIIRGGDFQRDTVYQVAVTRDAVFAATFDGVLRSTDGGQSWERMVRGLNEQTVQSVVANDVEVYAGTAAGIFRSVNRGENWSPVNTGLTAAVVTAIKEVRGILLAGTLGSGLYRSADNGITWQLSNNGLSARSLFVIASRANVLFASSFDTFDPGAGLLPGVYRSADNGTTWALVLQDSLDERGSALANRRNSFFGVLASERRLYAGSSLGRLWISSDGFSWRSSQIRDGASAVTSPIAAVSEGVGASIFAATLGSGLYRSDDDGTTWRKMSLPADNGSQTVYSAFSNAGVVFAGTFNGLYRSTNNGATWVRLRFPARSEKPTSAQVVDGTLYVATDGNGIWRTMDNGETWQEVNDGIAGSEAQVYSIFSANGTELLAGLRGGAVISSSLQLPVDAPRAFVEIPDTLRARAGDTVQIPIVLRSLSGNLSQTLTVSGVLRFNASMLMPVRSADRQQSTVINGERFLPVRFALNATTDTVLLTVPLRAVLGDASATPILLTNLQTLPVSAVVVAQNVGVFRLRGLSQSGGTRLFRSERPPLLVSLNPNPSVDVVTVRYQLFAASEVHLSLTNLMGQTLMELKESRGEGVYETVLATNALPTGAYMLVIQTPEHRIAQLVSIVR